MPTEDKALRDKLTKLNEKRRELYGQLAALLDEEDRLLGGGVGIGVLLKRLQEHYSRTWEVRYRRTYRFIFAGGRDVQALKALLKAFPVEEIELRMVSYLKNPDPFFVKEQHPLGLFVSTINQHVGAALSDELELDATATRQRADALRRFS